MPGKMTPGALRSVISDAVVVHADHLAAAELDEDQLSSVFDLTAVTETRPTHTMTMGDLRAVIAVVDKPSLTTSQAEKFKALDDIYAPIDPSLPLDEQIVLGDELVQTQRRRISEKYGSGNSQQENQVDVKKSKWAQKFRNGLNTDARRTEPAEAPKAPPVSAAARNSALAQLLAQ
jgi:hypothetical protein